MKDYLAKDIRNIAIIGHGGEGKTTLLESILYASGTIDRQGRVEDGTTASDFDPEEIKRHISLSASGVAGERCAAPPSASCQITRSSSIQSRYSLSVPSGAASVSA